MNAAERLATLGYALSVKDLIEEQKEGRLKNLVDKLQTEATREVTRLLSPPKIDDQSVREQTNKLIDFFGHKVGWQGVETPLTTYISFIILLLEKANYLKLADICSEIADYFNRSGNDTKSEYDDAIKAFDVWGEVVANPGIRGSMAG